MSEQTWTNPAIDRSEWGPGPWDGEPDKVSWTDAATGLPCLAVRGNPRMGNWCGYVAVEPGHPLHGKGYDDLDVEVHGGLTFADSCWDDGPVEAAVCHVPEPGKPADVWWFGFDCGHAFDIVPGMEARMKSARIHGDRAWPDGPRITYKPLEYVKRETARLAEQLARRNEDGQALESPLWVRVVFWPVSALAELAHRARRP